MCQISIITTPLEFPPNTSVAWKILRALNHMNETFLETKLANESGLGNSKGAKTYSEHSVNPSY